MGSARKMGGINVFEEVVNTTRIPNPLGDEIRRCYRAGDLRAIFPAGSAALPALLIGREVQMERLNDLAGDLLGKPHKEARKAGVVRPKSVFGVAIHGPRGTGKTAILKAFAAGCGTKGARVLELVGEDLETDANLAARLDSLIDPQAAVSTSISGEVEGGLDEAGPKAKGGASITRTKAPAGGPPPLPTVSATLARALRDGREAEAPLLITVDEAHAGSPATVGRLMNAVQSLGDRAPGVAFAMAGTPDLIDMLRHREAKATWFLDRAAPAGRLIPTPNDLPADAAAKALCSIISSCGVTIASDATLEVVAERCKGSPYFVQALGLAGLSAAKANKDIADFSEGEAVDDLFQEYVRDRYEEAWSVLYGEGLTASARQLGALWRTNAHITQRQVTQAIKSGLANNPDDSDLEAKEAGASFKHLGLLWSESGKDKGPWSLGLPSFFDYVESRYRNDPDLNAFMPALEADLASIAAPAASNRPVSVGQAQRPRP